jgi:hypothetical protein
MLPSNPWLFVGRLGRRVVSESGVLDNDGDLDVVITVNNGRPTCYAMKARTGNWLTIRLVAHRTNRDGLVQS